MKVETSQKKSASPLIEQKKKKASEKIEKTPGSKQLAPVGVQPLSRHDFNSLDKQSEKSRFPFVYLEAKDSKKKFSYKSLIPDSFEWKYFSLAPDVPMKNGFIPGEFDFFLKLPDIKKAVFIGSGSDIVNKKLNQDLIVNWALDGASSKRNDLKLFNIVALVGLFHSGLLFPKDEEYAEEILLSVSDSTEKKSELERQLIVSTFEPNGLPLARSLLLLGANPNCRDEEGSRPLTLALSRGHFETAKLLIEHGASVTEHDMAAGGTAVSYFEDDGGYDSSSSLDRLVMKAKAREEEAK